MTSYKCIPARGSVSTVNHREVGYPKVAGFEDCDHSLLIFRKFGWLHLRSLLSLQDELAEFEKTMRRLDKLEFADGDPKNLISRRRDDQQPDSARQELAAKMKKKLVEYDELLLRVQKIQAMKRPSSRAQLTLFNLIRNTESLVADEAEFIRYSPDLAALVPDDEHGLFNNFLEDAFNFVSQKLTKAFFRSKEQAQQTGDEELLLVDYKRMDILLRIILTVLASSLLLIPVSILFELQPSKPSEVRRNSNYQILTIFLFTLVFAASITIFTRARRQEVFQATAAYCAVLVIFLGNTSNVVAASNGLLNQTSS
ncbi:MAG: hypothetical protein OHK93_001357 [Ramalina farinacea]|uniref:DUF6594 domain-containing protein n=1 Tax=Ramalina farinacea TaxID=258253 RepID=A0AA43TZE9_9LECA|nr:hypothetical protein [Ramalina farinacea]